MGETNMKCSKSGISKKVAIHAGASLGAIIGCANPAFAQSDDDIIESDDNVIIVSAQRREQSLQDVPISISTFSADEIEKSNITEAKDYLAFAPNVSFTEDGESGNRSINISIRGVSNVALGEVSTQQSIGYYLDEQSVGSTANGTYNPQLLDIERIEVLRGPQGTFFGRNASGGALNITTKKPGPDLYAEVGAEYGRFDTWQTYGIVNVPLSENFYFRGLASYEESNGIVRNVNPDGAPNSGYEYLHFRGALRAMPLDNVTWDISVAYTDEDEGHDATVASGVIDLDTKSILGAAFVAIDDQLGFYPANQRLVNHNTPEFNRNSFWLINNRLSIEGDGFEVRSVTGYIDSKNSRFFDQDNISADAINRRNRYDGRSFSQELRVQSTGQSTFDWVIGGLYANDRITQFNSVQAGAQGSYTNPVTGQVIGLLPPIPAGFRINENNRVFKTISWALFADATWNVLPSLHLTAGGRYSHDKINNREFGVVAFEGSPTANAGKISFNDFSPRFVIRYEFDRYNSIYTTISKGYKAGGIDLLAGSNSIFQPERLWNYEVGFKGQTADGSLNYGASVFYLDWTNLQVQTNFLRDPNDISSSVEATLNAAKARNLGFEIDLRARLSSEFSAQMAFGYLDSKFDNFPKATLSGGNNVNLTGLRLPNTPEFTYSAALDYITAVNDTMDFYARAELNSRSSAAGDLEGVAADVLELPRFPYRPPAFTVVNFRLGVKSDKFEVAGFVENLLKEEYYTGTQDNFGSAGIRLRPHPRVWGINAKYKFGG